MAEIIEINGKPGVVGLDWKTISKPDLSVKKTDFAKDGGVLVSSKAEEKFVMIGEVDADSVETIGGCSFAAKIAKHSVGLSVLVIQKLIDDRYWFVLLQNGLPVKGSDSVVSLAEMEAKSGYYQSRIPELLFWGNGAKDVVMQDASHDGVIKEDISKLLSERCSLASKVSKSPFSHSSKMLIRYIAGSGLLFALWNWALQPAYVEYQKHQEEQALLAQKQDTQAQKALKLFKSEKEKYANSVLFSDFSKSIVKSWALHTPLDIDGWSAGSTVCEGASCKTVYTVNTPSPLTGILSRLKPICTNQVVSKSSASVTCSYKLSVNKHKDISFLNESVAKDVREKFMILKKYKAEQMVFTDPLVKKNIIKAPPAVARKVHGFETTQFSISFDAVRMPEVIEILKQYPELYVEKATFGYQQKSVLLTLFFVKKIK